MSLIDHAMHLLGVGDGEMKLSDIKPGFTVTKVDWRGCMATTRKEVDVGRVLSHVKKGRYQYVEVLYENIGLRLEPAAHFVRLENRELEVWS